MLTAKGLLVSSRQRLISFRRRSRASSPCATVSAVITPRPPALLTAAAISA